MDSSPFSSRITQTVSVSLRTVPLSLSVSVSFSKFPVLRCLCPSPSVSLSLSHSLSFSLTVSVSCMLHYIDSGKIACARSADALQNTVALPVPYQDRFIKKYIFFGLTKVTKQGRKVTPTIAQNRVLSSKKSLSENASKLGPIVDTSEGAKSFKSVVNSSKIAWSPVLKKWSKWVQFWGRFGGQNRCYTVF